MGFLWLLIERLSVEFALEQRLFLVGVLVGNLKELFVDELGRELLEEWGFVAVGNEFELEGRIVGFV